MFFIRDLISGLTAMKPSPTFPSNLQQPPTKFLNKLTSSSAGQAVQSPVNLNNQFIGGLGQISNSTNRVPMNQMRSTPLSAMQSPSFMQPSANPLMPSNLMSNQTKTGTSVSLSTQEINEFLK